MTNPTDKPLYIEQNSVQTFEMSPALVRYTYQLVSMSFGAIITLILLRAYPSSMVKEQGPIWDVVSICDDAGKVECNLCGHKFNASATRIKEHLLGTGGQIVACTARRE
jgi:hypothetical protein